MARKKRAEGAEGTAPAEKAEKAAGGKRGMLIPAVVVAVAVLAAGAMAGGMIGGSGNASADTLPTEAATEEPTELGVLVQLDSVTLNLAEGRFLKLGVAVELGPDVVEEPATAPIYDEVIELFSPLTFEQLSDSAVRAQTKRDLLAALGEVYGEQIVDVYYTEFVMQ